MRKSRIKKHMNSHIYLSDLEFVTRFERGELDPALFTHEAHLRMAWIYLKRSGVSVAAAKMAKDLYRYVSEVGAPSKYNHTITIAATKIVDHFMQRTSADGFQEFLLKNPRLKNQFRELLKSHYSFDLFNSPAAKATFIEPDLFPFD